MSAIDEVDPEDPPAWFVATAAFLEWRGRIERYGVDGALRMMAVEPGELATFDPRFLEALDVFEGELERLEHEERTRRAERSRRDAARDKAKAGRR